MEPSVVLDMADIKSHLTIHKFLMSSAQSYQSFKTSTKGLHTYGHIGLMLQLI